VCPRCYENVPKSFDVCWNCGTTSDGQEDRDFVAEPLDGDDSVQPRATFDSGASAVPEAAPRCARCGSAKIMPDVRLVDQGQGSDGVSKVVVFGNPDALLFKDRRYGKVTADLCGNCGHVELRVDNFRELYEHYRDSFDA